ncbi:hypothetical protein PFISCL1PPCAC_10188 [Pristionchus fissidentatus]|uniref:Uncharacterized protein n=1 Tax=Pristionchus fissidentatus TaxID=1538716 RepID=A0AAV5VJU7_9BILA|nr:hypothetical protein PFISCL1PPCAC_10188 [Pristionchus fissidentatus]
MSHLSLLLFFFCLFSFSKCAVQPSVCDRFEKEFKRIVDQAKDTGFKQSPCGCFDSESEDGLWIGCTGKTLPHLYDALKAFPESTHIDKIHVWDSSCNIVPSEFFQSFRPSSLIIERSFVSLIRQGTFVPVAFRLKSISLAVNQIKEIDPLLFSELQRLEKLDMSRNKLSALTQYALSTMKEVTELNLADNDISSIEDNAFIFLPKLKKLYLRGNKISTITNGTFKGLSDLEELDLSRNEIRSINWEAFSDMKKLKWLDLGTNRLTAVELRGLISLQRLLLNNNSIDTLKRISLRDLPVLNTLSLDRNQLTTIKENDFSSLSTSPLLSTLAIAANNISQISPRAFDSIGASLKVLSLQNNELKSLSYQGKPWVAPVRNLEKLLLSGNSINILKDGELPYSLKMLALDHNKLQQIDAYAFQALRLSHLYLNNNHLHHLPKGTFDPLTNDTLQVIDISFNDWQCLCGEEWLGEWLTRHSDKDIAIPKKNGCLALKGCEEKEQKEEESSAWITCIAGVLATVSVFILLAIAWLFMEEGKPRSLPPSKEYKGLGVNSDRLRLINDRENAEVTEKRNGSGSRRVRFNEQE